MQYTLVSPSGSIVQVRDFAEAPPALAPTKGKWLPDNPPTFNAATHSCVRAAVQSVDNPEIVYLVTPLPIDMLRQTKLTQLARARDAAMQADVTVQGRTFAANEKVAALFEQLGGRLRRGRPTTLTAIYEANGTPVSPVTSALIDAIEDAIATQAEAAWNKYGQLVGQVMAATTVEAVDAVAW